MKKKVTFEGFQCDACGDLLPPDYIADTVKIKMSGTFGCYKKDKMRLCDACAQSLVNMLNEWYSCKHSEREKNIERIRAILAEEKE